MWSDGLSGFDFLGFIQLQGILDTLRGDEDSVEAIVFDEEQLSVRHPLYFVEISVCAGLFLVHHLRRQGLFFFPFIQNPSWRIPWKHSEDEKRGAEGEGDEVQRFDCRLKKKPSNRLSRTSLWHHRKWSKMDRLHGRFFCHTCFHLFQIILWVFDRALELKWLTCRATWDFKLVQRVEMSWFFLDWKFPPRAIRATFFCDWGIILVPRCSTQWSQLWWVCRSPTGLTQSSWVKCAWDFCKARATYVRFCCRWDRQKSTQHSVGTVQASCFIGHNKLHDLHVKTSQVDELNVAILISSHIWTVLKIFQAVIRCKARRITRVSSEWTWALATESTANDWSL